MIKKTGVQEIRQAGNYPSEPIIVKGTHQGCLGEWVITIQKPQGFLSEIPWDTRTKFLPYMIDFILDDMGCEEHDGDNGIKARAATREYMIRLADGWSELVVEADKLTVGDVQLAGHHFYDGYMSALSGKIEL